MPAEQLQVTQFGEVLRCVPVNPWSDLSGQTGMTGGKPPISAATAEAG
jgi:hypothetical protein